MANRNPHNLPTQVVDLPSRGIVYPEGHPASSGTIEIMYPTAASEDILTNQIYLSKYISVDKYIESLLVTEVKIADLLPSDK